MTEQFQTSRRVEFCETDAAGIAHFSVFFQYMEQTEHAFLRSLGLSVFMPDSEGTISWPRVSAGCNYSNPVRFEDIVDIALTVERLGRSSVTYDVRFTSVDRPIAEGKLTVVCCRLIPGEPPRSIPIPEAISKQLQPYVRSGSSG